MKKQVFLLLAILISVPLYSQNTFVPDDHFEQALIDLGLDNVMDDLVSTGNIDTLSYLHVSWKGIEDLTGIEDFSSLTFLQVSSNNLTSLDVSQNSQLTTLHADLNDLSTLLVGNNTHLKSLFCRANMLTSLNVSGLPALYSLSVENNLLTQLNVSQNPLLDYLNIQGNLIFNLNVSSNPQLKGLNCSETPITTLNLSQNPLLNTLHCFNTQITDLDVSQNAGMLFLHCNDNPNLQSLNMKSGNNTGLLVLFADNNPELSCIQVDTPAYSQVQWTNVDSWVSFQEDCLLGLEESGENTCSLYPNPAVEQIHFSDPIKNVIIQDLSGRTIMTNSEFIERADLSKFPAGTYLLQGITENHKPVSLRFSKKDF